MSAFQDIAASLDRAIDDARQDMIVLLAEFIAAHSESPQT